MAALGLYQVIYWRPGAEDDVVFSEEHDDKYEAYDRLVQISRNSPDMVGFVFSAARNKRIMSIGVGLD